MGRDIRTNIAAIRRQIGYCPQYNVLFDELTVEDHLIFFCYLKVKVLTQFMFFTEYNKIV